MMQTLYFVVICLPRIIEDLGRQRPTSANGYSEPNEDLLSERENDGDTPLFKFGS